MTWPALAAGARSLDALDAVACALELLDRGLPRPLDSAATGSTAARAKKATNDMPSRHGNRAAEMDALQEIAARFGRRLHHVPGDGQCQFHALLHALNHQLPAPRAQGFTAGGLRSELVKFLQKDDILDMDLDDGSGGEKVKLRDHVTACAIRNGWSLDEWFAEMRSTRSPCPVPSVMPFEDDLPDEDRDRARRRVLQDALHRQSLNPMGWPADAINEASAAELLHVSHAAEQIDDAQASPFDVD